MYYVGIDIGGTWIKGAVVDESFFEFNHSWRYNQLRVEKVKSPLHAKANPEDLIEALNELITLFNIESENDFEILAPVPFNTICFRYKPAGVVHEEEINKINEKLLSKLNETGKLFLTHTKLNEKYVIRFMIGQTNVNEKHVSETWELIKSESRNLLNKSSNRSRAENSNFR